MFKTSLQDNKLDVPIISEDISKRITSLRFILIVFVVFIHADLKVDDAINYYHYDFIQPKWIEIFKDFICSYLGGCAVPLFFFFASYLQFSKNYKYTVLLKKRAKSLLLPYILWTCITIVLYYIAQSIPFTAPYFQNPINIVRNWNGLDWIKTFTYHNLAENLKTPLVYQFWFLRELMIYIVLSPVLAYLCKKFPAGIIFLASIAMLNGIPLFFTVSSSALFFYLAGFYFARYRINVFHIADKIKYIEFIFLLVLSVVLDLILDGKYGLGSIKTIIACLLFLKISKNLIQNEKLFSLLKFLSEYSFFLYAIHAPFISSSINKITQKIIPLHGVLCLVQFFTAAILTLTLGTLIGIICKKLCSKLFMILNGGR